MPIGSVNHHSDAHVLDANWRVNHLSGALMQIGGVNHHQSAHMLDANWHQSQEISEGVSVGLTQNGYFMGSKKILQFIGATVRIH